MTPLDLLRAARAWLLDPVNIRLTDMENRIMADLTALQTAVARSGATTAAVALLIPDLRGKLNALTAALAASQTDTAQADAITASLNLATDALAQAIAPSINDETIPTGDVAAPDAVNNGGPGSTDAPDAVPAGAPLGEDLDPDGYTADAPGADAVAEALEDAVAPLEQNDQATDGS